MHCSTLGDLSVRYTQLVSPHLGTINALLEDRNSVLRRNALLTLSSLCAQDYVKLKPDLLLRILRLVGEAEGGEGSECGALGLLAKEVVERVVRVKNANLLQGIFVEAFVVLAGCSEHSSFRMLYPPAAPSSSPAPLPPSPLTAAQRMCVYEYIYLLSPPEGRVGHVCRLVGEILGAVVDHPAALRGPGMEALLGDVFLFLQSPLLKIKGGSKVGGAAVEAGDEEEEAGGAEGGVASKLPAIEAARNKVDTHLRQFYDRKFCSDWCTIPLML